MEKREVVTKGVTTGDVLMEMANGDETDTHV